MPRWQIDGVASDSISNFRPIFFRQKAFDCLARHRRRGNSRLSLGSTTARHAPRPRPALRCGRRRSLRADYGDDQRGSSLAHGVTCTTQLLPLWLRHCAIAPAATPARSSPLSKPKAPSALVAMARHVLARDIDSLQSDGPLRRQLSRAVCSGASLVAWPCYPPICPVEFEIAIATQ